MPITHLIDKGSWRGRSRPLASGSRLKDFVDAVPAPLALADGSGSVRHANPGWKALFTGGAGGSACAAEDLDRILRAGVQSLDGKRSTAVRLGALEFQLHDISEIAGGHGRCIAVFGCAAPRSLGRNAPAAVARLTPRERAVGRLLAEGLPSLEIAHRLGRSKHTVRRQIEGVMRKLGVRTRSAAVAMLVREFDRIGG